MPLPIRILIALLLFLAVGAIAGGSVILSDPSGAFAQMSPRDLAGSPFPDFFMPGLLLLVVLGFGSAVAAFLLWKLPGRVSWFFAVCISIALVVWIAIQIAIIGYRGWLRPFYASLGVAMLALLTTRSVRAHGRAAAPGHLLSK